MGTNEVQIANEVAKIVPPSWQHYVMAGVMVIMLVGRAYHAITTDGSVMALFNSIVKGTNTPKAPASTNTTTASK